MSRISTAMSVPDDENAKAAVADANSIIESEAENIRIEIELAKAIRVGLLMRSWRKMMTDPEAQGSAFPEEWVDQCALDIWQKFFPPPVDHQETIYDYTDDD